MNAFLEESGLKDSEYAVIQESLGRIPNQLELRLIGAMWSEHCSYKSTKHLLKLFSKTENSLAGGAGENAGLVKFGEHFTLAFKVESHNHPSAVAPYDGAATGVGGVVRDIFAMGALPIASMGGLCLGEPDSSKVKELAYTAADGIKDYSSGVQVPVVGGKTLFDKSYQDNPLVNAFCAGVARTDQIVSSKTAKNGEIGILLGRKTNCDGVGSAAFASKGLEKEQDTPRIPQGIPEIEKNLIDACLELRDRRLITAMQDMGAAGLLSSSSEIALKSNVGLDIYCDKIQTDEMGMAPWQLFLSETQERMFLVAKPGDYSRIKEIATRYDLYCDRIADIVPGSSYRVFDQNKLIGELPLSILAETPPSNWESKEPSDLAKRWAASVSTADDFKKASVQLIKSSAFTNARSLWEKFTEKSMPRSYVGPGAPVGVVEIADCEHLAVFSMDVDPWKCQLDPRRGAAESVLLSLRDLYAAGANALGITDGLNYASPEKPERFWEVEQSVLGIIDAAQGMQCPVVSGNVSLYNESETGRILPTPFIVSVGMLRSKKDLLQSGNWKNGERIYLVGSLPQTLAGSRYAALCLASSNGRPASIDISQENAFKNGALLVANKHLASSVRVCSGGGLLIALLKEALATHLGAEISMQTDSPILAFLGEGGVRAIYSVPPSVETDFMSVWSGIGCQKIGTIGGDSVTINNEFSLTIDEIQTYRKVF